jgi:small-conductance mechanosensitive channel
MNDLLEQSWKWLDDPVIGRVVAAVATVALGVILIGIVQRTATRYIADKHNRYRARKAIAFVGYFVVLLLLASVFSDRLGRVTVMFGVAGAGIAFALQEVIASTAGFAAISFGGFYKVGDRVQLGGIKGDVIDIGLLRTTLMEVGQWVNGDLYNGRVVRVANSFIFKEPVVNYSGDFPFLWDELTVPIRFGSDLKRAQALLEAAAREVCGSYAQEATEIWNGMKRRFPLEDATAQTLVTLGFDHNWVTFTVRYSVRFDRRRMTKHQLSLAILDGIEQTSGAVSVAASAFEVVPKAPLVVTSGGPADMTKSRA